MKEIYLPKPDQFEIEKPAQPKMSVGDYVAEQGLLVPARYLDLDEAQYVAGQGVEVMARSEHPDEYSGPSSLGHSAKLVKNDSGEFSPEYRLTTSESLTSGYEYYADVAGLDPRDYAEAASVSYWEKIPGTNITVVADDVIEDRYHIFGHKLGAQRGTSFATGAIVGIDGSMERATTNDGSDVDLESRYIEIIETYNKIRGLDKFNDFHCPIVEMQISEENGQIYFLQYHRSRDLQPLNDKLDPKDFDSRDGWTEADFVRGAYIGNRVLELAIWYPGLSDGSFKAEAIELPEDGYSGMDCSFYSLNECIGRQRIAHIMPTTFDSQYRNIAANHGPRSQMFKPQASILMGREDPLPEDLSREAFGYAYEGHISRIKTEVVSDGKSGYVKYANELIAAQP